MKKLIVIAFSSLLMIGGLPPAAFSAEDVVCAAVYPCDENGVVEAPFNQPGACLAHYQKICLEKIYNRVGSDLVSCSDATADLQRKNQVLKKQNRRLMRKLGVDRRINR